MPNENEPPVTGASPVISTVSVSSSVPNIEKLEGQSNYGSWKFAMKMSLMLEGLYGHVTGSVNLTSTGAKDKDDRALAKICLSVKPSCYVHIRSAATAKQAWDSLNNAYESSSEAAIFELTRKFFNTRQESFGSMEEYITDILETVQKLADVGEAMEDKWISFVMRNGVNSEYEQFVSALNSQSKDKISSADVKVALLGESERRRVKGETSGTALISVNAKKKSKHRNKNKKVTCYECGEPDHVRPDCPNKGKSNDAKSEQASKPQGTTKQHQSKPKNTTLLTTALLTKPPASEWVIDSGATSHMSSNKEMMSSLVCDKGVDIAVADDSRIKSVGTGKVVLELNNSGSKCVKTVTDVMYVPSLSTNLLSVNKMTEKGYVVVFDSASCKVFDRSDFSANGTVELSGSKKDGLYTVDRFNQEPVRAMTVMPLSDQELWHKRLGHLSRPGMRQLREGMATGINFQEENQRACVTCLEGKQTVLPFPKQGRRATERLELIHSDVQGPLDVPSWGGARYCLIFIDDYTRKVFGFMIQEKGQVFSKFVEFKAMVENQTGKTIKCLRTDNGGEYTGLQFEKYLKDHGIRHQVTVPYSPQQNGVAERTNRSLGERVRCMLFESNLEKRFWGEAMSTAIYLKNRTPTKAVVGATPEEAWSGEKIDISHLRIFGCRAQVHVPKAKRRKLDKRSEELIFVGYCEATKGYRFVNPQDPKRIVNARSVVFIESSVASTSSDLRPEDSQAADTEMEIQVQQPVAVDPPLAEPIPDEIVTHDDSSGSDGSESSTVFDGNSSGSHDSSDDEGSGASGVDLENEGFLGFDDENMENVSLLGSDEDVSDDDLIGGRYPNRVRVLNRDPNFHYAFLVNSPNDPQNFNEANARSDKLLWSRAMEEELDAMSYNQTWELVDRPHKENIVKCRWVYKLKKGVDGSERYKARLVARGFTQVPGRDYFETFAPVVKLTSLRILFGLAAELDLEVDHIDVTTAFLNGDLSETIYMEQPQGFVKKGTEGKVCKLKKAIYGLKQAARCWNVKIDSFLVNNGYTRSLYDPCVYVKKTDDVHVIIGLHVDDFYVFSNCKLETKKLKDKLSNAFKIRDLGAVKECLGMRVTRDRTKGIIKLDQEMYVKSMISKFGMEDARTVKTPLAPGQKLDMGEDSQNVVYQKLIGTLMYIAVCTRPDICHAVSYLSQFNSCNNEVHYTAAKRVVRYLKGTMNIGLCFQKSAKGLVAYADADYAGCIVDRNSYTGYLFMFSGSAICWRSRKQRSKTLADSTTYAEYVAISECGKESIFIRGLMKELHKDPGAIVIFNDNQGANKLCENNLTHDRSKHIDVKYHQIRLWVKNGMVKVKYLSDEKMVADILTKGLPNTKHETCLKGMGMMPCPE